MPDDKVDSRVDIGTYVLECLGLEGRQDVSCVKLVVTASSLPTVTVTLENSDTTKVEKIFKYVKENYRLIPARRAPDARMAL